MRSKRNPALITAAVSVWAVTADPAYAVNVGNNPGGTSTTIVYTSGPFGGPPSFLVNESVTHDPAAGNLLKDLTNTSQGGGGTGSLGIPSGTNVPLNETFTNTGTDGWSAWTERVVSTTNFTGGGSGAGFLFDDFSPIAVRRNGVLLVQGVDYTLSTTSLPPGLGGGNNGYSEITFNLAPSAYILPTDNLNIQKQIHEVSGDSNVWSIDEAARVAQFPTAVPEPGAIALLTAAAGLTSRRRPR